LRHKKSILAAWLFFLPFIPFAQVSNEEVMLLRQLDSLRNREGISRHFAALYFTTTVQAARFFEFENESGKEFIRRMETRFAGLFFRAVNAYSQKENIPSVWYDYFRDSLSPVQYRLLGINAHINGDIWQALTREFNLQELLDHKKTYYRFQKGLARVYRDFYNESVQSHTKTRVLNNVSLGVSKWYGKELLRKWRKRQLHLAILHFTDQTRFQKELEKTERKRKAINQLIITKW
jgi:hypothetical protein